MTFAQRFALCLLILGLAAPLAVAGPNLGGVLMVHDAGLGYTYESTSYPSTPPADCQAVDNELPADAPPPATAGYVWKVYAAFPPGSNPRLKALPMGESFTDVTVLAGGPPDPEDAFEIPQDGWPTTSGGGDGISFGFVKTDLVNEVYWFGGYSYSGTAGGIFSMAPHPVQEMIFVDDAVPPNEDQIRGLGSIGFGVPGSTPCPEIPIINGACCFAADGSCQVLEQGACATAGGTFQGEDAPCDPNPCPQPPGACCFKTGACEMRTQTQCDFVVGAIFWGVGTVCDPNPCPLAWACCHGGACEILTQDACNAEGGTWKDTFTCEQLDPVTCEPSPTEESSWGRIKQHYGR